MASQATITSKTGPGSTVTALVVSGLRRFDLDLAGQVLRTESTDGKKEFDLAATTTLTCTITAGANATLVVSQ